MGDRWIAVKNGSESVVRNLTAPSVFEGAYRFARQTPSAPEEDDSGR
jgi:hypothetical protein